MSLIKYLLPGIILILFLGIMVPYSNSSSIDDNSSLFQVSTLNYLSEGNFGSNFSVGELKKYGNTGIGTFNGLDGEMIELNNIIYQVKSNGTIYKVNDSETVPYAIVLYFKPDKTIIINESMNYTQLLAFLNATVPSKELVYCFKIIGTYDYVKARSPQEQNQPYPNLTEALKTQSIFNLENVNGTMVGFWYPASASSLNLNDYHFHFINDGRNTGGHVVDLKLKSVIVEISYISDIYMFSKQNNSYYNFNLKN